MITNNYKVYIHTNNSNNKKYIGITKLLPHHRWRKGGGYKKCTLFYSAIQKYGWDNFKHEVVLVNLTKEQAEMFEVEMIKYYKSNQREFGYNITSGGCLGKIVPFTEEHRRNLSLNHADVSGKNNPNYGKHWTAEQIEEMRIKRKGKTAGEKNPMYGRRGKDNPNYGQKRSEEVRRKMSENNPRFWLGVRGENHPSYGRHLTAEEKEWLSKNHKTVNNRIVICVETKELFISVKQAGDKIGSPPQNIGRSCKTKRLKVKGLHFMYIEDYLNTLFDNQEISNLQNQIHLLKKQLKAKNNIMVEEKSKNISKKKEGKKDE